MPSAATLASRRLKFSHSFPEPQPVSYSIAASLNMLAELSKVGRTVNTREDVETSGLDFHSSVPTWKAVKKRRVATSKAPVRFNQIRRI